MQAKKYQNQIGTHLSFALLNINLVTQDNEGEILWIMGARLNQELVPPAI
jgi:hypothetical protein